MNISNFIQTLKTKIDAGEIKSDAQVKFIYDGMKPGEYVDHIVYTRHNVKEYWIVVRDHWTRPARNEVKVIYTVSDLINDLEKELKACRIYNNDSDENIFLSFEGSGYKGCPYKVEYWEYNKDINAIILCDKNSRYTHNVTKYYVKDVKKEHRQLETRKLYKSGYSKMFVRKEDIDQLNKLLDGKCKITINENVVKIERN